MKRKWNDKVFNTPISQYGWVCPKCGAVMSPNSTECSYCKPTVRVTCGTGDYINKNTTTIV